MRLQVIARNYEFDRPPDLGHFWNQNWAIICLFPLFLIQSFNERFWSEGNFRFFLLVQLRQSWSNFLGINLSHHFVSSNAFQFWRRKLNQKLLFLDQIATCTASLNFGALGSSYRCDCTCAFLRVGFRSARLFQWAAPRMKISQRWPPPPFFIFFIKCGIHKCMVHWYHVFWCTMSQVTLKGH